MAGDPELRLATGGDAGALEGLVAAFRDHLGATTPTDADLRGLLPTALADPRIEFVIARGPGDGALGYTQTHFTPSIWSPAGTEAHLEDLFVVSAARGTGLGLALLEHAVARAVERGAGAIRLATNERNEAALRLYTRAGFVAASEAIFPGGREIGLVRRLDPSRPPRP